MRTIFFIFPFFTRDLGIGRFAGQLSINIRTRSSSRINRAHTRYEGTGVVPRILLEQHAIHSRMTNRARNLSWDFFRDSRQCRESRNNNNNYGRIRWNSSSAAYTYSWTQLHILSINCDLFMIIYVIYDHLLMIAKTHIFLFFLYEKR